LLASAGDADSKAAAANAAPMIFAFMATTPFVAPALPSRTMAERGRLFRPRRGG
jgi:hypothetical protein